jgi:hypothetical protein
VTGLKIGGEASSARRGEPGCLDKIIAELEAGRMPWVRPWGTAAIKAPLAMPRNASVARKVDDGMFRTFRQFSAIQPGFVQAVDRPHL